jgi:hypothetical protein
LRFLVLDTDSIILSHPRGRCPIKQGNFLGDMAQEYPDYNIIEMVAAGPKQYAVKMKSKKNESEKYILKIRGITFDKHNDTVLPYEKFKTIVLETFSNNSLCVNNVLFNYLRLGPDAYSNLLTRPISKIYKPFNKKGFIENNILYPYGYCNPQ